MKHDVIDHRSLALHEAMAEKLRHDPELIQAARATAQRWLSRPGYENHPALREWLSLLDLPLLSLIKVMLDPSEEGARLRQSSPFVGILTEEERLAIFAKYAQG